MEVMNGRDVAAADSPVSKGGELLRRMRMMVNALGIPAVILSGTTLIVFSVGLHLYFAEHDRFHDYYRRIFAKLGNEPIDAESEQSLRDLGRSWEKATPNRAT